jgi:hypothetical protein
MAGFPANTAAVEVGAGATVAAGGVLSPGEIELFAIRGKHRMFALRTGCELSCWSASYGDFGFAVNWEMVWSIIAKTMSMLMLSGGLG